MSSNNLKPLEWIRQGSCIVITSHKPTPAGYIDVRRWDDRSLLHRMVLRHRLKRQGKELRLFALHTCDNPRCVNPDHLFEGTQADNIHDMDSKGRRRSVLPGLKGMEKNQSKLTDDDVRYIRSSRATQLFLGERFGVNPSVISRIKNGKAWKHVI